MSAPHYSLEMLSLHGNFTWQLVDVVSGSFSSVSSSKRATHLLSKPLKGNSESPRGSLLYLGRGLAPG